MIDFFKKTFLAGVGATVTTKEMVEKALNEYVEKGRLTADEASKVAEKVVEDGKHEFEDGRNKMNDMFNEWIESSAVVSRREFKDLRDKVDALEAALAAKEETEDES